MANWSETTKHLPSEINQGKQYEKKDRLSREQLNAITENSFYAVAKSDEALEKANSAFKGNGTIVSIGGQNVENLNFTSDPQIQIDNLNYDIQGKADFDLSNVTYPENIAGDTTRGAGDRVVETYISSDGLTWYRKWASGWKECGGKGVGTGSSTLKRVVHGVAFSNTDYTIMISPVGGSVTNYSVWARTIVSEITQTDFGVISGYENQYFNTTFMYYCCGY